MVKANFPKMFKDDKCVINQCNERETSEHIFNCKYFNDKGENSSFESMQKLARDKKEPRVHEVQRSTAR